MSPKELQQKINLVMDKLIHLGGADYDQDKNISLEDAIASGNVARDFGIEEWDWPQGVGLYGLCMLQEYYQDDRFMDFFQNWFDSNIAKGLPSRNINTTAPYLTLIQILDCMPNSEKYEKMCIDQANWLINELPKTKDGGFQHVTSGIGDRNAVILNEQQLWLDTLFMAVLFLQEMGNRYDNEVWRAEALHQVLLHIKYLYCKNNGLFYHGFSFIRNDNFGGIFWCRGNSWFTLGITLYLTNAKNLDPGTKQYLIDTFRTHASMLRSLQADSGLFHTILDDSSSYEEASGTAAIAAGLLRGIKLGILDESYMECAQKAIQGICNNIDTDGTVLNVSAGTAMGMNADHYKGIGIRPMAYGQALSLIALCEAL
ncbi:glycoside hydrolase family 88 protein [bacterium]|nr:glycoside hydrolase family 88 protein [bacterium]MDY3020672.1 glycoside hydrolase family 88 protein [Oliverpabstia sp.]